MSTTQVIARKAPQLAWLLPFRKYLTPATLWGAVVALTIAIGYVINAQSNIRRHDESIAALQKQHDELMAVMQQSQNNSNDIKTQVAVMSNKIDAIADEEDRQREWRERIEGIAESPPHARRRRDGPH